MSKLIETTAMLFGKREREEWDCLLYYLKKGLPFEEYNKTRKKKTAAVKIWFWALKRWGKSWPETEYNINHPADYPGK